MKTQEQITIETEQQILWQLEAEEALHFENVKRYGYNYIEHHKRAQMLMNMPDKVLKAFLKNEEEQKQQDLRYKALEELGREFLKLSTSASPIVLEPARIIPARTYSAQTQVEETNLEIIDKDFEFSKFRKAQKEIERKIERMEYIKSMVDENIWIINEEKVWSNSKNKEINVLATHKRNTDVKFLNKNFIFNIKTQSVYHLNFIDYYMDFK